MILKFRQKIFSWFDSYDVFNEYNQVVYRIRGRLDWGHRFVIFDANGKQVGMIREKIISLLPQFQIFDQYGRQVGSVHKQISFFRNKYFVDLNGWHVQGDILDWSFHIMDRNRDVAYINRKLIAFTDTFFLNIYDPKDALLVLMCVVAIDAQECTEGKNR